MLHTPQTCILVKSTIKNFTQFLTKMDFLAIFFNQKSIFFSFVLANNSSRLVIKPKSQDETISKISKLMNDLHNGLFEIFSEKLVDLDIIHD